MNIYILIRTVRIVISISWKNRECTRISRSSDYRSPISTIRILCGAILLYTIEIVATVVFTVLVPVLRNWCRNLVSYDLRRRQTTDLFRVRYNVAVATYTYYGIDWRSPLRINLEAVV